MDKLIKTQYIFVNSKNRSSGSNYNFTLNIPNRYIECEDDELLAITLLNFNMFWDWYAINDTNNSFSFRRISNNTVTVINLPSGNYTYKLLYQTINALFGSDVCVFNKLKNTMKFHFAEPYELSFNNQSYEVLGFNNSTYTGTLIESVSVLNPMAKIQNICVHIDGIQPYRCYNLHNLHGDTVEISNLLMAIPYTNPPFDVFSFSNQSSEFRMFINDKRIQTLNIRLTDFEGNDLTFIPECTMCFKLETYIQTDEDEVLQTLKKLLEYQRMSFLSKHLK
jgi:hypothetical protein